MKGHDFQRSDRVGQQIHELVAQLFVTTISDPRLTEVEITDVDVSPNLRNARIYYVLREGEEPTREVREALKGVARFIKSRLGGELQLRYVPSVEFRFDEAADKGRRIDELLSDLKDD